MNTKAIISAAMLAGAALAASQANAQPKPAMEKCYGVAAAGKNDCAAGAHSCAGQATRASDKMSFVELPMGACSKLAGGSLTAGK